MDISKPLYVEVEYDNLCARASLGVSIHLMQAGGCVLATGNGAAANLAHDEWGYKPHLPGTYRSVCRIPENFLNDKHYTISAFLIHDGNTEAQVTDAISFTVVDSGERRGEFIGSWIGAVRPKLAWTTRNLGRGRAYEAVR